MNAKTKTEPRGRLRRAAPEPRPPEPILYPGLPAQEAARRLFEKHFRALLDERPGTISLPDSRPLHDLRVAIRRMRMVLRAFRKPLKKTAAATIDLDLRRLNSALGGARDLDVWTAFLTSDGVRAELGGHRLWARFIAHQRDLRRIQQATVRRHLTGSAFAGFARRVNRFLDELAGPCGEAASSPVEGVAREVIAKQVRNALRLGHLRNSESVEKQHRLRKSLRKLRYLAAFFEELLGPPVRKIRKRAHAVESAIGDLRDAELALGRILKEGPPPPRALVRGLKRRSQAHFARVESAWRGFHDPKLLAAADRALGRP